ncbi:MAG: aminobenzoyl-glutamate transporter [Gemmatales bacterium]|nr:MAG: aminobenzoyl-glutamate transporter [Gemmatales bacterium]
MTKLQATCQSESPSSWLGLFLSWVEGIGNRLPDPVLLFAGGLLLVGVCSAYLSQLEFDEIDPRANLHNVGEGLPEASGAMATRRFVPGSDRIRIRNLLSGSELVDFLTEMVGNFTRFPPLGIVLVALLGIGVAERTGFMRTLLKVIIFFTPRRFLTPVLMTAGVISNSATGYVLVVPMGGAVFHSAGRHPLAGIVCGFAAVSGGFSANFLVSPLEPLMQGFTQSAAQMVDAERIVNPLCNYYFMALSCVIIVAVGWFLTDKVIEPRLWRSLPFDAQAADVQTIESLTKRECWAFVAATLSLLVFLSMLLASCWPEDSLLRNHAGSLWEHDAALMKSLVPLMFLLFLIPGVVYGYAAGTATNHRDIIRAMSESMSSMGYYIVLVFFAAQFIAALSESNLGVLLAVKGGNLVTAMGLPPAPTVVAVILLTALINLFVGSASAKWAFLSPIFVPMLMNLSLSPELCQAAYRIGDSSTNIITPLMPYFPLVVVYAKRYVPHAGLGTLIAQTLPYSCCFLTAWTLFLLIFWYFRIPLGLGPDGPAPYDYP